MRPNDESFPRVPWRRAPLLLALYAAAVAALSWPWLATASTCVLNHWDPPFHAWKLAYAAHALLDGHVLPPGGDTNLYYPHSGAFFYEALHWPQAVFAAPLLAAGVGPVATYHATLLFFWAFSGTCFWALLRALGLGGRAAALGGLFYTVAPWRMSYLPEFNMQLAFGLPLLLFAMVRFFQRPGCRYALLGAVAWWLQATSELYQAVFVLFALPLLALPLLAREPKLLLSGRRFWGPLALAAAVGAALSLPMLWPYAETLGDGTLHRSLLEMRSHALQPFSYLLPWGRIRLLPSPRAVPDEMSVYPTLALLAAAAAAAVALWRRRSPRARRLALAALAAPALAAVLFAAWHFAGSGDRLGQIASAVLCASVALSLAWLPWRNRSLRAAAGTGLAAAALFGFAMSLGPLLTDASSDGRASNVLFLFLHDAFPALGGFRVVSRFSLFPFAALCAAAAWGAEAAGRALDRRPRFVQAAAVAAFLAVFFAECLPPRGALAKRPVRDVSASAVLAELDARTEPYVLAVVPMGLRDLDSEHMLTIERNDRLGVWAWGGTYPQWTLAVDRALKPAAGGDPEVAAALLRQLWPEALVLEDRRPFPPIPDTDWPRWFGPLAETVSEDPEFRLLKLVPDPVPRTEHVRLVRRDLAAAAPVARFALAAPDGPARVWLDLNGTPLGAWDAGPEPRECAAPFDPSLLAKHLPQRFRLHAKGDRPFRLVSFRLGGAETGAAPDVRPEDAPDLPWTGVRADPPPEAVPLDLRYSCGFELRGVESLPAPDGSGLILRLWIRPAEGSRHPPEALFAPGFEWRERTVLRPPTALRRAADGTAWETVRGKCLAVDVPLPWAKRLVPGEVVPLVLDVTDHSGRLLKGRDGTGRKVSRIATGIRVTVPERTAE